MAMAKNSSVQIQFLEEAMRCKTQVTLFLMNGFQMKGHVVDFDDFIIKFESDGKVNYIFKHAISTITPNQPPVPRT